MSVNYSATVLTNRLQQVLNAIDAAGTNGNLRLLDIGGGVLSSLQLARPSGTISGAVFSFSGLSLIDPAAAASGTAQRARVEDGNGNTIISGLTVSGGATADIIMTPTNIIAAGQTIAITAATITGN